MASKLLHSLADDNPDLQKQIGCMTGIFQLFDQHHIVTPRHKRLPPGDSHINYDSIRRDSNSTHHRQEAAGTNFNKGVSEKQRVSTESSRASFSSSCSSSMSSLDCKAQSETPFERSIFPETPVREPIMSQTSTSPNVGRQSLDLRDVVKDSMYREARGLSVKTVIKGEIAIRSAKHRDSPRPLQLTNSVDGYDAKQNVPIDLKESIRVLSKLREAPWHYGDSRELPRLPYEVKDGHWYSVSKDAPRFSYDAREVSRLSFESRETIKSTQKIKEHPRLSLDSREVSWRSYSSDSRSNHPSRNFSTGPSTLEDKVSSLRHHQSPATQSRPPSVVAKLMGLEALPESNLASDDQSIFSETGSIQGDGPLSRSSRNGFVRPLLVSNSSKTSGKDLSSPHRKDPDLVVKPMSSARVPIEPAPWKQQGGNRSSPRPSSRKTNAPSRTTESFPSVYSEIDKRLQDLEFEQSGRDLRALKQILEAIKVKGFLETRQEKQASNIVGNQRDYEPKPSSLTLNSRTTRKQSHQGNNLASSTIRGSESARTFESPIVIMKPANFVEKTGISASSVIPIADLSDPHKLQSVSVHAGNRKSTASGRIAKDHSPRYSHRNASASASDAKTSNGKTMKAIQSQQKSHQSPKENSSSSIKNSGSVSPRLQQKKLELEKRSRPPTPPSDSNKPRRQSGKQTSESGSPGRKLRPKVPNSLHSDDQFSDKSNDSRSLSCQGDEVSMQSDGIAVDTKMEMEVTSRLQSGETIESQIPSMKSFDQLVSGTMHKKSTLILDEDEPSAELAADVPDHPSPVSVLDGSIYREDTPTPVKLISNAPEAGGVQESKENDYKDQWNTADDSLSVNGKGSGEINRKKLQSIDHLVQKLRRLNSTHDEARNDYIASLCENTNPDHRYISEILLASGLLLRDLNSELLTFQHHPSGHPINPELFLVLEQTKASSFLAKEESSLGKDSYMKLNTETSHRRLIFDAVNEILSTKLVSSSEPWLRPNGLVEKNLSAQKLLKELCFEIEKIQSKKPECNLEDEGDSLKSILWEDVMHRSESFKVFHGATSGVVLDVERLIFKDLVDEIVIGESSGLRIKSSRRRKLFGK